MTSRQVSATLVRSLESWLVFGGAAYPALKLAERCGQVAAPGRLVELLAPLLVLVPVGAGLIGIYHERRLPFWKAFGRVVLLVLVGAAVVTLIYHCDG